MPDNEKPQELPWEAAFVENITGRRKAAGISQTEFARRVAAYGLPFHQQTVQRIESGKRPIRLNEATVICDVLQTRLSDMTRPMTREMAAENLRDHVKAAERTYTQIAEELRAVMVRLRHRLEALVGAQRRFRAIGVVDPELDAQAQSVFEMFSLKIRQLRDVLIIQSEHESRLRHPSQHQEGNDGQR